MRAVIPLRSKVEVSVEMDIASARYLVEALRVEAGSAPPGGEVKIFLEQEDKRGMVIMVLSSDDLSTLRAMLNSYMGLLTAAGESVG